MPTLSVLCMTDAPGPQVRAALAPLRTVADEIVAFADARVGTEDLAHYAAAADRVLRVEFAEPAERQIAWAHAQCRGDWILRIDGDEVVSPELVAELPALIARRDRLQYWFPRRWCYPDAEHWIDEVPWTPDHQLRLVRNDPATLWFPGTVHSSAAEAHPGGVSEHPIYHVDLLTTPVDRRRAKAEGYERLRPGLVPPGGGPHDLYYDPETWIDSDPAPVPEHHRPAIAKLLRPTVAPAPAVDRSAFALGTRDDVDALWDGRPMTDGDYRASILSLDDDTRTAPGVARHLTLRITNRGGATWPGGIERHPRILLGYGWRRPDGREVVADAGRTPLPSPVVPGETIVARVLVVGPRRPGRYLAAVDLVHEGVRWFEQGIRIPVAVLPRRPQPRGTPGNSGTASRPTSPA